MMEHPNPGFERFDWRSNPEPALREFVVFRHVVENNLHKQFDCSGYFSSRFLARTRLDGATVRQWIEQNPGYDAYTFNPYPQQIYAYYNIWERGDWMHAQNFTALASECLALAGLPYDLTKCGRHGRDLYVLTSSWAGSPTLWEKYGQIVCRVLDLQDKPMPKHLRYFLFEEVAKYIGFTLGDVPIPGHVTFVLERMMSTLLEADKSLRVLAYPVDAERMRQCSVHPIDRAIVETFQAQVDDWDARGSYDAESRTYFRRASALDAAAWFQYLGTHGARWMPRNRSS